jgi:cellulose synthase/poly-beta-1,6-N-acetylglucosamine synthase-like glycosyltransferase
MEDLRNFLVAQKVISAVQLDAIKEIAESSGSSLPEILLSEYKINPKILYSSLAKFHGLEFADLQKYPCDKKLLNKNLRNSYHHMRAIPWKKSGDFLTIAVCEINEAVRKWAAENFTGYSFAITSPFDINSSINNLFAAENDADARHMLLNAHPEYSANNLFGKSKNNFNFVVLAVLVGTLIVFPQMALLSVFTLVSGFYIATLLAKTLLFLIGALRAIKIDKTQKFLQIPDSELPIYTILVPLYKEDRVLAKLVAAIKNLDYPKSKLDVKLIVEEDDAITLGAIKALKCERVFEIINVPYSIPRTKPKACNYALRFAKGEFVTIYDAEDIPEPLQLKKSLYSFYHAPKDVACVQAKLAYFNREENLLSRMFALEYSILFDFMLFGLMATDIPIPLGGTSNHFRVKTLRELYAWDPYNVTEDADLGLRIAQKGWKCVVMDSYTMEECPITLGAWIRQRSRWIKGHMQTYFVHMRKPFELYKKVGLVGFFGVQFFLGAPVFIFLISPLMWLLWAGFMVFGLKGFPLMANFVDISNIILSYGIATQIFCALAAIMKNRWKNMYWCSLLFPFYWILHSVAAFRALWQLITRPHYWEKTSHGVTRIKV